MWIFGILFGIFFVIVMIGQINSDPQHQLQQYEREQKEKAQNDKQRKEAAFMQAGLNEFRFDQVGKFPNTETCFIYVAPTSRLSSVYQAMSELKGSSVKTWYVFERK